MVGEALGGIGYEALRYGLMAGMAYQGWGLIKPMFSSHQDTERMKKAFYNCRLYSMDKKIPQSKGREKKASGVMVYKWSIPAGLSLSDFLRRKEDLEAFLDSEIEVWLDEGLLYTKVAYNKLPPILPFNLYRDLEKAEFGFPLGVSREGMEIIDLGNSVSPHLMIAGATGMGKSALIRQGIVSMMLTYGPDRFALCGVDLKGGVELSEFSKAQHTRFIATNLGHTLVLLRGLNEELDSRLAILKQNGAKDWSELRRKGKTTEPRLLLVLDEFADLNPDEGADRDEKALRQQCHSLTSRLLRLSRAAGIHLVVCTQRPDHKALPGQLKANIDATVCLRVKDKLNSEIILKNGLAAQLPPIPGRAIFQFDRDKQIQIPFLPSQKALQLLKRRGII